MVIFVYFLNGFKFWNQYWFFCCQDTREVFRFFVCYTLYRLPPFLFVLCTNAAALYDLESKRERSGR